MSSGSGKREVAVAAEKSNNSNILPSLVKAGGGIKILIDKSKIGVSSTSTVAAGQNDTGYKLPKVHYTSKAEYVNSKGIVVPVKLASLSNAICSGQHTRQVQSAGSIAIEDRTGEMRVKVTGDDIGRNGASVSGAQVIRLKQISEPVPARAELSVLSQQAVTTTTVRLAQAVDNSKPPISALDTFSSGDKHKNVGPLKLNAVNIRMSEQQASSKKIDLQTTNQDQKMQVVMKISSDKVELPATVQSPQTTLLIDSGSKASVAACVIPASNTFMEKMIVDAPRCNSDKVIEEITSVTKLTSVAKTSESKKNDVPMGNDGDCVKNELKNSSVVGIATEPSMVMTEEVIDSTKSKQALPFSMPPNTDENSSNEIFAVSEENLNSSVQEFSAPSEKPSREIRQLQEMHSKSKVLTEFIHDASREGKFRKRRLSSAVGAVRSEIGLSPAIRSPVGRRRHRSRSIYYTITSTSETDPNREEAYSSSSLPSLEPSGRAKRMRPVNTEISPQNKKSLKGTYNIDTIDTPTDDELNMSNVSLTQELSTFSLVDLATPLPGDAPKPGSDLFCWRCKKSHVDLACNNCARSYHKSCVRYSVHDKDWSCADCKVVIYQKEVKQLEECLDYALKAIMYLDDGIIFNPIVKENLPLYDKYITHHMDLTVMQMYLASGMYKCTASFLSDLGWIVHNMQIYPRKPDLLKSARAIYKICKQHISDIEDCHECFINSITKGVSWFTLACTKPHLLVWAKLKGYPHWPGKLLAVNGNNQANVRFFGGHDRAWCPLKDCYLFSKVQPKSKSVKRSDLFKSLKEAGEHINIIMERFGSFHYAEYLQPLDPRRIEEQLRAMIPGAFNKKVMVKITRNEGTMVAVASSSTVGSPKPDELVVKNKIANISNETLNQQNPDADFSGQASTKTLFKRMTRRMSRYPKSEDEMIEPSTSSNIAEKDDHDVTQNVSYIPKNPDHSSEETIAESNHSSKAGDHKKRKLDGDAKKLSLLIRRNSESWETEPLSKRRKSIVDNRRLEGLSPQNEKQTKKKVSSTNSTSPSSVAEKDTLDNNVVKESTFVQPLVVLHSNDKTLSATCTNAIQQKTIAPTNCPETTVTTANELAVTASVSVDNTDAMITGAVTKLASKNTQINSIEIEGSVPVLSSTDVVSISSSNVVNLNSTVSNATSNKDLAKTTPQSIVPSSVVGESANTALPKDTFVVGNVPKTMPIIDVVIKEEPNSNDESASEEQETVELSQSISSISTASPASDIGKKNITSVIATNGDQHVREVSPMLPIIPIAKTNSPKTNVVTVQKKQKARKSFPGGALNAQPARVGIASNHTPSMTVPALSSVLLAAPPQPPMVVVSNNVSGASQPFNSTNKHSNSISENNEPSSQAHLSPSTLPKDLVPFSTSITLSCDNKHNNDNSINADVIDCDDVVIVEEETPCTSHATLTSGRKRMQNNQQLPPLQPKPQGIDLHNKSCHPLQQPTRELLEDCSVTLASQFCNMLEETLSNMADKGSSEAASKILEIKLERCQKQNQQLLQTVEEMKKTHEREITELRRTLEEEYSRKFILQRQKLLREKDREVLNAKKQQWCKKCFSEALFYCCWNTSYCNRTCQQKDWSEHEHEHNHCQKANAMNFNMAPATKVLPSASSTYATHSANVRKGRTSNISPLARGLDLSTITTASLNRVQPSSTYSNRLIPNNALGSRSSYKTPIIHAVHGRDNIPVSYPQHTYPTVVTASTTTVKVTNMPQPHQSRPVSRGKPSWSNSGESINNASSKGTLPKHLNDVSSTTLVSHPFRSANKSSPTATTAPIRPTYTIVTAGGDVSVSSIPTSVWNQIASQSSRCMVGAPISIHTIPPNPPTTVDGCEKEQINATGVMNGIQSQSNHAVVVPTMQQQQGTSKGMIRHP